MTKEEIGRKIKEVRTKLELTQAEFADLFNRNAPPHLFTSRSDVARYERGINGPSAEKFMAFLNLAHQ